MDSKQVEARLQRMENLVNALQSLTDHPNRLQEVISAVRTLEEHPNRLDARITALGDVVGALTKSFETVSQTVASLAESLNEVQGTLNGWVEDEDGVPEDETPEQRATRVGMAVRLNEIETLVRGRNTSAPVKRNMTDADAVEALTGRA